jgi:hypothetical protein
MPDLKVPIEAVPERTLGEIRRIVEHESAEFIKKLPELVRTRLEACTAKLAGMEKDWGGKWKVDNCNGRQSTIGTYLTEEAKRVCEQFVGKIGASFTLEDDIEQMQDPDFGKTPMEVLVMERAAKKKAAAEEA